MRGQKSSYTATKASAAAVTESVHGVVRLDSVEKTRNEMRDADRRAKSDAQTNSDQDRYFTQDRCAARRDC